MKFRPSRFNFEPEEEFKFINLPFSVKDGVKLELQLSNGFVFCPIYFNG